MQISRSVEATPCNTRFHRTAGFAVRAVKRRTLGAASNGVFITVTQAVPEIAFDEAGNTGADLLSSEQPVFALASVSLSHSEANEILASIRTAQTKELKFTRLRKSESGRHRVVQFLLSPKLNSSNVKTSFFHKRFLAASKVVDLLVETLADRAGVDLYKTGAHVALSKLHFYCMPTFCGKERTEKFLHRFVEMFRQRTLKAVRSFYDAAHALYESSCDRDYADMLVPILLSEPMIGPILANSNKNSLDPAIPAFVQHCAFWGEHFGGSFDLVHDRSKSIFQEQELLEDLMSRGEEEHLIGYGPKKFIFPLRARGITFGRSEDDPRLQVADLVAGASANWLVGVISSPEHQDFWEQMNAAGISRFELDAIWPTPDVSPSKLGTSDAEGINAANHVAEFLSRHRNNL